MLKWKGEYANGKVSAQVEGQVVEWKGELIVEWRASG